MTNIALFYFMFVFCCTHFFILFQLEKSLAAACSQADSNNQSLKQQLSEMKSSLSLEKAERGRESANNQVILRYYLLLQQFITYLLLTTSYIFFIGNFRRL